MNRFISQNARWLAPVASIGAFVVLWGLVSLNVDLTFCPSPESLAGIRAPVQPSGGRHVHSRPCGIQSQTGSDRFWPGRSAGTAPGSVDGLEPDLRKIVAPIFEVLRPIPPIAWIPIAILWLGVAEGSKIFICFVGAFVIMILNSYTGMRYVDPLLIDAARSFGASRSQQFFNVAVPACMPSIFAGVQNSLSMAWMCVLAAEMVGAREGVGYIIIQGMDLNKSSMILVGMVLIGIVGSLLAATLRCAERLLCPWRREMV